MFYAQFVLSKKGPLAKIWLAAHWEKKLSKAQIYETNVQDAVDEILKPKVKMALRTTGHLLLGIVRIYSRKTKYLLADCNEAFLKIKMAFRGGQLEVMEDGKDAPINSIALPDAYSDFDMALPDINDIEFANHLQVNQSRIDDITLKDDQIMDNFNVFNNDLMDDFGEGDMGGSFAREEDFADDPMSMGLGTVEMARDREASANPNSFNDNPSLSLHDAKAPGGALFNDDDFGGGAMDDDDEGKKDFQENYVDDNLLLPFHDNASVMDAPGSEIGLDDLHMGAAANNMASISRACTPAVQDAVQESFALEPLDQLHLDKMQEKRRRKRRLIIDEQKNISGDEMKANMADFRDTLQQLDLAPPTRKLMKMRETGAVEKLFHLPGCPFLRAKPLVRVYQSHLVLRARQANEVPKVDEVRKELELSEHIEDDYYAPESMYGDDFEDIGPVALEPMGPESPVPLGAELDAPPADVSLSPVKETQEDGSPLEKKRKKANECRMEDDDTAAEGDDDHRWTKRTQSVLNSIAAKIRASENDQIMMNDLLTKGSTRKTVAQKFYTLLVLKKWQAIDLRQDEPYGEISISGGPNIAQTVAQ